MMFRTCGLFVFCVALLISVSVQAGVIGDYANDLKVHVRDTWNNGDLSVYVPVYAWHNRLTYDKRHIDKYNENPWGFGVGLTYDEDDVQHGLYAMGFKDSNKYLETMFGYTYLKRHAVDEAKHWKIGYGYTLGLTQRHEYKYIPVPLPLPIAALSYRNFSVNATYVPGVKNDGNVLFSWIKFDF